MKDAEKEVLRETKKLYDDLEKEFMPLCNDFLIKKMSENKNIPEWVPMKLMSGLIVKQLALYLGVLGLDDFTRSTISSLKALTKCKSDGSAEASDFVTSYFSSYIDEKPEKAEDMYKEITQKMRDAMEKKKSYDYK